MSRLALGLLLALFAASAHSGPVAPAVPCDRPVMVFGDATVLARGANLPAGSDFVSRLRTFFKRVCARTPPFVVSAREAGRFVDDLNEIRDALGGQPGRVVFIHYPYSDIGSGVSVDALLDAYRRLAEACRVTGAICILGGQQPVEAFTREAEARQIELEARAEAVLGSRFLPLYRHFQSEAPSRRLMVPLDSGDGRLVNHEGHRVLFELYRRRLIEMGTMAGAGDGAARPGTTAR